ncbi:Plant organelle RNA recognition domain [Macleaya cordata]|uniref:Plant organelle RNA recognition domain n=1 Tax=Macleaya cordata TaxID=56857 RepID=A0A200QTN5_MACCD|nr:Plant organelle RNA recognition domain [Macleaya cordata]
MPGSLFDYNKVRSSESFRVAILQRISSPLWRETIQFGPFNLNTQKRWKKPVDSAQTRMEERTRDLRLDKLMSQLKRLKTVLGLQELMSNRRGPYVSLQLLARWRNIVGLNVGVGVFLHKYPHIFEIFTHPRRRNLCSKLTQKMIDLIEEEAEIIKESELETVQRLKKLLMISTTGTLHIHALRLVRRELGLPEDFRDSILLKHQNDFKLVDLEIVALVSRDESLAVAEVEKWREKEYREKWLSEFETKYAFQIHFPTGFTFEKKFREKLKNWQRMPYLKPYETKEVVRVRTCGGMERFEKRAVGILHEFLSLTVEKMVDVERLAHFRRDFNMEVNVRELLLKHPGIFYISTKGNTQTVFLREAYSREYLIEPNPIYMVRRKMLDLLLLGCRNSREVQPQKEINETHTGIIPNNVYGGSRDGDWVIPILESFDDRNPKLNLSDTSDTSEEELDEICENSSIHDSHIRS